MNIFETIRRLKEERPHLKDPLELYEKVLRFEERANSVLSEKKGEETLQIIDAFTEVFSLPSEWGDLLKEKIFLKGKNPFEDPWCLLDLELPYQEGHEEDLKRMLFILSKPFFKTLRLKSIREPFSESNRCPICGEYVSLSRIDFENKRYIVCPLCGYEGRTFRIGCMYCLKRSSEIIDLLVDEDEIRVELCRECNSYSKSFREETYQKYGDPNLIDIISLPLEVVAQKRGFIRRSSNAIGVKVII